MADIWSEIVIDGHSVIAEYVEKMEINSTVLNEVEAKHLTTFCKLWNVTTTSAAPPWERTGKRSSQKCFCRSEFHYVKKRLVQPSETPRASRHLTAFPDCGREWQLLLSYDSYCPSVEISDVMDLEVSDVVSMHESDTAPVLNILEILRDNPFIELDIIQERTNHDKCLIIFDI